MLTVNDRFLTRVNKKKARNIFNNGETIFLLPCKTRINNYWLPACAISLTSDIKDFDSIVNEYEYYNCNYELGYYCAYYVKRSALQ